MKAPITATVPVIPALSAAARNGRIERITGRELKSSSWEGPSSCANDFLAGRVRGGRVMGTYRRVWARTGRYGPGVPMELTEVFEDEFTRMPVMNMAWGALLEEGVAGTALATACRHWHWTLPRETTRQPTLKATQARLATAT